MSDAQRKVLLESTRSAAAALLDELQHMREALDRSVHSAGEVRRLSVTLRRLLVNSELITIAPPRMGRFHFQTPDIKPFYNKPEDVALLFHACGIFTCRPSYPFGW